MVVPRPNRSALRLMAMTTPLAPSARAAGTGTFDGHAFNNSRQGECVPMLGKMAKTTVRAARCAGRRPHLASGLQGRRKSANILASSGVIWGMSAQSQHDAHDDGDE